MQTITSKENEQIKHIRKLKEKKYRDEFSEYIIEGEKLIKEAILEKQKIKNIVICDGCDKQVNFDSNFLYEIAKLNCITVPESIFKLLGDTVTPQGVLAVVEKQVNIGEVDYKQDLILVLDNIQDPGNLGTILRTIDSANINQVIISKGTVDPYSSKVVRSTMGAIFRVNIIESLDLEITIKNLKKHGIKIYETELQAEKSIYDVVYTKCALVIGNEAKGIEKNILELADEKIKIPMLGRTESLNAAVATGIIVYEYVRRK